MHTFDYTSIVNQLLTTNIVNLLSAIHEYKVKQSMFIEGKHDILSGMLEIAKVESTEASNKIEGIFTSDDRLNLIVKALNM